MRYARIVLGLLLLMSLLACGNSGLSEEAVDVPVWAALVPADTELIQVIDWAQAAEVAGVTLDSATQMRPASGLVGFMGFTAFNAPVLYDRALLGWDMTDVQRSVHLELDGRDRVVMVMLRDEVPFADLGGKLEALGYQREQVEGGSLYSFEPTRLQAQPWSGGKVTLANLLLLDDPQLVIIAIAPELLQSVLAAKRGDTPSLSTEREALKIYAAFDAGMHALLAPDACSASALNGDDLQVYLPQEVERVEMAIARLQPYESLGIGVRYVEGKPVTTIILRYADAASAEADLAERRRVAEAYFAQFAGSPEAHSIDAVRLDGASIIFEVRTPEKRPVELMDRVYPGLLTFVMCP